ncbi:hypothetical protein [Nocardia brasiliensis]|uniref:hypothetical protein n=1 Tax=Nocardia brasiliensis TaxID=37326 RepID=UPI00366CEC56
MSDPLVGLTGTLTSPIRGAGMLGEVQVAIRGGMELFVARATEAIPVGATVLIIDVTPGCIVDVVPWIPLTTDAAERS